MGQRRYRRRKLVVWLAIVCAGVLAWPEFPTAPTRSTEVAGAVYERDNGPAKPTSELGGVAPAPPPPRDVVIAPPPDHFDAPPAPAVGLPERLRRGRFDAVQPEGGTWAVMVGVNDYPGSRHDLRSAVADAEEVNRALAMMGVPESHRLVIRDREASADTLRVAVDWLNAHAAPEAVAVFFYAGHVRQLGGGTEAIVGADGQVIHDSELAARLSGLKAKRAWIALASCYAGGFTEVLSRGRILTGAASADSLAYENEDFGRSYLVEYMVRRALVESQAGQHVQAAFQWARDELARDYPNRVPVQYDDAGIPLDLRQPGSAPAPAPASPPRSDESAGSGEGADPDAGGSGTSNTDNAPPSDDTCSEWTLGVVRCGEGHSGAGPH